MAPKKYFSHPANNYVDALKLAEIERTALEKEPENAEEIQKQYAKATEQLDELLTAKRNAQKFDSLVAKGGHNIGHAVLPGKIKKMTVERWLKLSLIGVLVGMTMSVVETGAEVGVLKQMQKKGESIEKMKKLHENGNTALYASWLTIFVLMALAYTPVKQMTKHHLSDVEFYRSKTELYDLLDALRRYIVEHGMSVSLDNFAPRIDEKHLDLIMREKDLEESVAWLHKKQSVAWDKEHKLDNDSLYAQLIDVCTIVVGSMSDKDIRKLYSLLLHGKIQDAQTMLMNYIESDTYLDRLVVEVYCGVTRRAVLEDGTLNYYMRARDR